MSDQERWPNGIPRIEVSMTPRDDEKTLHEHSEKELRSWIDDPVPRAALSEYGKQIWQDRRNLAAQLLREREYHSESTQVLIDKVNREHKEHP